MISLLIGQINLEFTFVFFLSSGLEKFYSLSYLWYSAFAVSVVVIVAIVVSCITGTCYHIVSCQCGCFCCHRRQLYYRYV